MFARWLVIVLVAVACATGSAGCGAGSLVGGSGGQEDAATLRGRSITYFNQGDYRRTISTLDQLIALEPDDSNAYYDRGLCYANLGELERALADLDQAVRLDPTRARALRIRGNLHDDLGQFDEAIADYTAAIAVGLEAASSYRERGQAYRRQLKFDAALADLSEAIRLNPQDGAAYYYRGITHSLQGNRAKARADLESALPLTTASSSRQAIQAELDALSATTYTGTFIGMTSQRKPISIDARNSAVSSYSLQHDVPSCGLSNPQIVYLMADSGAITDGRFSADMSPRGNMRITGFFGSGIRAAGAITLTCDSEIVVLTWEVKKQ